MTALEIVQGSDDWFAARLGKVTASRIADVMAKTKNGYGAGRKNYMAQLVAERLTGTVADSYTNAAMQWGIDTEPQARAAYELLTDQAVQEVGFVEHPAIAMSGASPDGLVGDTGMVEIKCPNTATHIDTLLAQNVERKYMLQMQWQMACAERAWCDFVSFDPRMPGHLQLFVKRVARDAELVAEIQTEVEQFLVDLTETVDRLEAL